MLSFSVSNNDDSAWGGRDEINLFASWGASLLHYTVTVEAPVFTPSYDHSSPINVK